MKFKLDLRLLISNSFWKFGDDQMKTFWVIEQKPFFPTLEQFKGHNSKVPVGIFLDIELDLRILVRNNIWKFGDDQIKTFWVIERKPISILDQFKGHNSEVPAGIFLVIELDLRILVRNNIWKFGDDQI